MAADPGRAVVTPRMPSGPVRKPRSDGREVGRRVYGVIGCRGLRLVGCGGGLPANLQPRVAGRYQGRPALALRSNWLPTPVGSRGRQRAAVRGRATCSVPSIAKRSSCGGRVDPPGSWPARRMGVTASRHRRAWEAGQRCGALVRQESHHDVRLLARGVAHGDVVLSGVIVHAVERALRGARVIGPARRGAAAKSLLTHALRKKYSRPAQKI